MKNLIIKKWKYEGITIGYQVFQGEELKYTIDQSDNRTWNVYEGEDTLKGRLDTFETLREAKEAAKNFVVQKALESK